MGKTIPKPSLFDSLVALGAFNGHKRWRSADGKRLYTWDALHGEIEVFDQRGRHLGALEATSGVLIKPAVPGRRIDV